MQQEFYSLPSGHEQFLSYDFRDFAELGFIDMLHCIEIHELHVQQLCCFSIPRLHYSHPLGDSLIVFETPGYLRHGKELGRVLRNDEPFFTVCCFWGHLETLVY